MAERILVVGCAMVTCLGLDLKATWDGLIAGRSGLRRHESLPASLFLQGIAGLVDNFGPGTEAEDLAVEKLPVRSVHLALAAARAVWTDTGLHPESGYDPNRVAVVVGSAFGGVDMLESVQARMARRESLSVSPYLVPGLIINMAAGQISQHLGLHGPSVAPSNACATGGHAVALGGMMLQSGEAELAICGAAESAFTPPIVNGFATMRAIFGRKGDDRGFTDPAQASRPFSVDRAGFIMSEGAGLVVLATESAARRLGLRPRAELLGWSWNADGHHMSMPNLQKVAHCLATSLARAGVRPERIDYYNAHGTSTVVNDRVETQALKDVFGGHARRLPVSSLKGALGHSLGAASAIEAVACVQALQDQVIPPTLNHMPDPELDLDYVPEGARPAPLETVLSASFGFGGTNNALVFSRWNGD
jgi:3-oxoacyl-[acyl-carrier-protein] synthase II